VASRLRIQDDHTIQVEDGGHGRFVVGPGPVALIGDLSLLDFSDLLNLIVHARMSGVLRVTAPAGDRTLTFDDGELRGTTSTRVGERLSEVIVRMGFLKMEEMDRLLAEAAAGQRIGRIVVERGLLSERDLWNVIQEQVTAIFQSIIHAASGLFTFSEGSVESSVTVPGLSVEALLIEGLRRIDERNAASPEDQRGRARRIVEGYNEAFRDIFITARESGSGEVVARASGSAFAGDAFHALIFEGLRFTSGGEVPVEDFLRRFEAAAKGDGESPEERLHNVLSKAMLFLLFVTGEHLDAEVQRALHARAKSITALVPSPRRY
jgi:hypothetical protein